MVTSSDCTLTDLSFVESTQKCLNPQKLSTKTSFSIANDLKIAVCCFKYAVGTIYW